MHEFKAVTILKKMSHIRLVTQNEIDKTLFEQSFRIEIEERRGNESNNTTIKQYVIS